MTKRQGPWPPHIEEWLALKAAKATSDRERDRIQRLAYDNVRLKDVAPKLAQIALDAHPDEDALRYFLEEAILLANSAEYIATKGMDFFKNEVEELAEQSERYLKLLTRHKRVALLLSSQHGGYSAGLQRYEELRRTIQSIAAKAAAGLDVSGFDYYLTPSRKGQEHTYFVRKLGEYAEEVFGDSLDEEVGILAAVCFNLEELGPAAVRALRKPGRKVNSKS